MSDGSDRRDDGNVRQRVAEGSLFGGVGAWVAHSMANHRADVGSGVTKVPMSLIDRTFDRKRDCVERSTGALWMRSIGAVPVTDGIGCNEPARRASDQGDRIDSALRGVL